MAERETVEAAVAPIDDGVDAVPPARRLVPLAFQHVLVMYAGAVAVPLVVGRALDLPPAQLGMLISADLVACGFATLIQTLGLPLVGIRLPIVMGVTFASISPMLAMIAAGHAGGTPPAMVLRGIYGAVIVAGLFGFLVAPFVGRLSRLFPPAVTGTVILSIGLSLMRVGINWSAGGQPTDPGYGAPLHLLLALLTLVVVLCLMRFGHGLVRSGAVLAGTVVGTVIAGAMGQVDLTPVREASWFALVMPFQYGAPSFDWSASIAMCLVMMTVMIESFGMFMAAGQMVGRPVERRQMVRGLRGDAVGTLLGGVFNTFPYTSFAQNIGLLSITGVRSRFVCAGAGVILLALGVCPKLATLVAAVPLPVLGGAALVMFGMIAATGIRILGSVELTFERLVTIAVSIAVGLIPVLSERFFQAMPSALAPLLHSGIVLASISAVGLNAFFGSRVSSEAEVI
ncbi:nucleobase:cation symporter-2 family protein [Sphingomonas sp. GM_Shp_1]|uniref:nucleobase:cation symporter-2 family protein n=1 Tax=Sphingomonas sp. GM_Shp_1 TaxID=2937381 RepID=UPI00226B00CD|nr:nucleobase:cation symporter-2 family protein [Sphingomonas sp. GM_Shp_1]